MHDDERDEAATDQPASGARALGAGPWIVHAIAVFSGVAALIYEVVWTRRLTFVFGASIRAVSAVLAAYMAGLALGALIASHKGRAGSTRRPLLAYAALEAGVAVAGWSVPTLIAWLRGVDSMLYDDGAATGRLTAVRFALALVVVGAPAALMGATFPLLVRRVPPRNVATLYAANTLGAVIGTFFAGFYAIGELGVAGTERVAVALNLAVALAAALTHRFVPAREGEASAAHEALAEQPSIAPTIVLASTTLVGVACIASEVLWSRALAFRFSWLNNTTYTFPAMLGVVLAGVAFGSLAIAPVLARTRRPGLVYGALVSLAGVLVAVSALVATTRGGAPFGRPLDIANNLVVRRALANVIAEAAAVVAAPAVLFGAAFPAAIRAATSRAPSARPLVARLYAASTAGAIAGSLLAAFVIVPRIGIARGILAVGAALAVTGLAVLSRAPDALRRHRAMMVVSVLCALAAVRWRLPARPQLTADNAPVVFYEEGPTATVTVARAHDGYLRIDVDGVPVAGTSPTMLTDQKSLAHVPMLLVDRPRRALTVGFGSGGTSHSYLLHDRLDAVHAVEIAPEMLHGAPYLTASNHGLLARRDPRYRVVLDDARSYLAHTQSTYDIIATDCTDLRYRSNANLYDLEYFRYTRARLSPGGVVAVWLPVGGLSRAMFKVALRTFGEVFSDFIVTWPNGYPSHYVVLVGWRDRRALRWDRLSSRMAAPRIADDLREISLADPAKMLSTVLADGRSLRAALADAPINTEDRPVLEFQAPLQGYSPRASVDNLEFLLDHRASARAMLEDELPPRERERLDRMDAAMATMIAAHGASFSGETLRAARLYLEALAIARDDVSVRDRALEMLSDLRGRADEPEVALALCRAEQLTGDRARARACYASLPRSQDESIVGTAARWSAELQ